MKNRLIVFVFILTVIFGCSDSRKANIEINDNQARQDTSFLAKQQIRSKQKLESLYDQRLIIDTVFVLGSDLLNVRLEYYCLTDTELTIPASNYEIQEDFKTHDFASIIEIKSSEKVIYKEVIEKGTFNILLFDRLKKYGVLMFPSLSLITDGDKDLIKIHHSVTIPGTDVGTSATLYLNHLGERRVSQY